MTETQPVERCEAYITQRLPNGGAAFAIRSDTGEAIFIPAKTAQSCDVQEMDEVECLVKPNLTRPENAPWFAIKAVLLEGDDQ